MNAQCGIEVSLVFRLVNGIDEILYGYLIVAVPYASCYVVFVVYGTCIVSNVPSSGEVLCEASDIVTIGIHKTEIAVCLQQ